jgi:hypothetical protein
MMRKSVFGIALKGEGINAVSPNIIGKVTSEAIRLYMRGYRSPNSPELRDYLAGVFDEDYFCLVIRDRCLICMAEEREGLGFS